jgi:DNA-binding transcriptional LysR family regulator
MKMNNLGTLQDLAVFVAVAETEGFSAAAKRLAASKAMVSVAIARLEAELGVRLFQRTTRRLSLTEAGQAALPHAQRAMLAARDAEESATQALVAPRGVLRVNAPMSFGLLHVVPALGAFAQAFSEVRVDLVLDDRVLDFVEGGFDLSLRVGTLADSSLIAHRLATGSNVIAAHPSYLERAGTPQKPSELGEHSALIYSLSPTGARWTFTRGAKTETIAVRGPLRVNNSLALHQALLQGLGLARIPRFVVGEDLAKGRLVQVLSEWALPDYGVFALTADRELLPRKTRAFIDFFRERLGEPPYWERAAPSGDHVSVGPRSTKPRRPRR